MWFLMLGHFLGDYAFQSDRTASTKAGNFPLLFFHVLVYTLTIAVVYITGLKVADREVGPALSLAGAFGGVFILHAVQDWIKGRFFSTSRQVYYLDQALHVIQLFVVRIWLG